MASSANSKGDATVLGLAAAQPPAQIPYYEVHLVRGRYKQQVHIDPNWSLGTEVRSYHDFGMMATTDAVVLPSFLERHGISEAEFKAGLNYLQKQPIKTADMVVRADFFPAYASATYGAAAATRDFVGMGDALQRLTDRIGPKGNVVFYPVKGIATEPTRLTLGIDSGSGVVYYTLRGVVADSMNMTYIGAPQTASNTRMYVVHAAGSGLSADKLDPSRVPGIRTGTAIHGYTVTDETATTYVGKRQAHMFMGDGNFILLVTHGSKVQDAIFRSWTSGLITKLNETVNPVVDACLRLLVSIYRGIRVKAARSYASAEIQIEMTDDIPTVKQAEAIRAAIWERKWENTTPAKYNNAMGGFLNLPLHVESYTANAIVRRNARTFPEGYGEDTDSPARLAVAFDVVVMSVRHIKMFPFYIPYISCKKGVDTIQLNQTLWRCKTPAEILAVLMSYAHVVDFHDDATGAQRGVPWLGEAIGLPPG